MRKLLLFLSLLVGVRTFAQTRRAAVDSLEMNYQLCLAQSRYTYGCALEYYQKMDSMLDIVYRQLYASLDTTRRRNLKVDQSGWLERKASYFKLLDTRVEKFRTKTLAGLDDQAISTDQKAAYIKERVTALIKNYPVAG
ncbi:lysozyme inhibitor LprI family protein [uncultured Chitinophaga sp.]|jgi:Protein of unknown function (DUF1311).|uniref:lysozyme inhibitor LprI family protein n=1 Tax=uncultured Chitinophaga sp. TaxID=339340 RepID=UPI0026070501|nr:lysozyme inhibitor LprI family protein [uncultured Chitinophaga sp.]